MRCQFTPAAERALAEAARWTSGAGGGPLRPPEVLLGLLAEPECRAAIVLARHGIDAATVRERFAGLAAMEASSVESSAGRDADFSPEWEAVLWTVEALLVEHPRPLELATEHLLLGLATGDSEVARWLAERGLRAADLEAEVHRWSGHQPGPLPLEPLDEPLDLTWSDPAGGSAEEAPRLVLPENERIAPLRVIDAAANRASEGLRVVEDYLRFSLDDRHLTGQCKAIRHDLTAALRNFSSLELHAARETQADVGTEVTTDAEQARPDTSAVVQASFKRVEQALRSLEEYSKTLSLKAALALERLRYRVYTLERAVDITRTSLERLATARLYVLIDGGPSPEAFETLATSLIAAGVSVLQLRDKQLPDRELLTRARLLRTLTRDTETLFIMNDRADLAVLSGAHGVHVGQDELSVKDARRILGPQGLIGVSTHSIEQARAAVLDGANYIGVGPTFPSGTKQFSEFTGPELLRAVAAEIRLPAFAIGGITLENLPQVLDGGFTRVAVSGAVTSAADPGRAAAEFLSALLAE